MKRPTGPFVLIALLSLSTLVALLVDPLLALAPIVGFLLLYALYKLPLRVPVLALIAAGFVLEIPFEGLAEGKWHSPFAIVGALLFAQLKQTIPIGALVFTGFDVVLLLLFAIHVHRRATGSTIDSRDAASVPMPLIWACWAALGGCAFAFLWGMARGGTLRFSLWQIQRMIYIPLLFLLLQAALPNLRSCRSIGRLILICACLRSVLAIYLRGLFPKAEYATTHADSMLFAVASCIVIVGVMEERRPANWLSLGTIFPLLAWGMIANDRRLVWVEIAVALVLVFSFGRATKLKIKVLRGVIYLTPVILAYIAAGWGSGTGVFAPVATIRSLVDSKSDGSTMWRDLENYNLVSTLKRFPVVGTGFGHPYDLVVALPDITNVYELEPYAPHNSILGLWVYTGYFGFAAHWMTLVVTVYFAMRSYRLATDAKDRVVAMVCFCAVVIYMVHLYGDLALGSWASIFLVSSAMVTAGKLAASVGAWPGVGALRSLRRAPPPLAERSVELADGPRG